MGTRITTRILFTNSMANLHQIESDLSRLQEQLSTGRVVNRPSDNPVATRRAIGYRSQLRQGGHFLTAIRDTRIFVSAGDSTLDTVTDAVQRVYTLLLQAANTTVDDPQRAAIASEVDTILGGIIDLSNTRSGGRQLFGGSRTLSPAFESTTVAGEVVSVQYMGNSDEMNVQIDSDAFITANQPGDSVFMGAIDMFQWLIDSRDDLRANDLANLDQRIGEFDTVLNQILVARATYGARENRLNFNQERIEDNSIVIQDVLSQTEDADFAETIMRINLKEVALNAALSASARIIQPSLLDFL
jgi:flagellar hook-associated protein 3 FlgL